MSSGARTSTVARTSSEPSISQSAAPFIFGPSSLGGGGGAYAQTGKLRGSTSRVSTVRPSGCSSSCTTTLRPSVCASVRRGRSVWRRFCRSRCSDARCASVARQRRSSTVWAACARRFLRAASPTARRFLRAASPTARHFLKLRCRRRAEGESRRGGAAVCVSPGDPCGCRGVFASCEGGRLGQNLFRTFGYHRFSTIGRARTGGALVV